MSSGSSNQGSGFQDIELARSPPQLPHFGRVLTAAPGRSSPPFQEPLTSLARLARLPISHARPVASLARRDVSGWGIRGKVRALGALPPLKIKAKERRTRIKKISSATVGALGPKDPRFRRRPTLAGSPLRAKGPLEEVWGPDLGPGASLSHPVFPLQPRTEVSFLRLIRTIFLWGAGIGSDGWAQGDAVCERLRTVVSPRRISLQRKRQKEFGSTRDLLTIRI